MARKKSSQGNNDMKMKMFILAALFVAFIGGYFIARAKYKPQIIELSKMVIDKDAALQQMRSNANKLMMKDDKMMIVENGEVRPMDTDVMMPNGDKVTTDGKILKTDGTSNMLQNGDAIDMDGKMMSGNTYTDPGGGF